MSSGDAPSAAVRRGDDPIADFSRERRVTEEMLDDALALLVGERLELNHGSLSLRPVRAVLEEVRASCAEQQKRR